MSKTEKGEVKETSPPKKTTERSPLGWIVYNMLSGPRKVFMKRPIVWFFLGILAVVVTVLALLYFRFMYQPFVMGIRFFFGAGLIVLFLTTIGYFKMFRERSRTFRMGWAMVLLVGVTGLVTISYGPNRYFASYFQYKSLNKVELDTFPKIERVRVLPLNAINSLAKERINQSQYEVTDADLVGAGDHDIWSLAKQPARWTNQIAGSVIEIFSVSATTMAPDFSQNRDQVNFRTGEKMMFHNNTDVCTRRSFGLLRFFTHEPGNLLYMKDDSGEWVQVVSLIKWKDIFFPKPAFGGVQVIQQEQHTPKWQKRWRRVIGCGKYVSPRNISKYPFLRGQNLVAPKVTRYIAESIRFQEGILGPLPGVHRGDVRIPDLPADMNQQPFTIHAVIPGEKKGEKFAWFGLEPFDPGKRSLAVSVFVPADGSNVVYVIRHDARGENLIGVSAVREKVKESNKNIFWDEYTPAENRPYTHVRIDENGKESLRPFWLTTIVGVRKAEGEEDAELVVGTSPEIAFMDAVTGMVVWADSSVRKRDWPELLEEALVAKEQEEDF